MQGFETRKAALSLLTGVLQNKEPLDRLMETSDLLANLSPRDRSFVHALTATTLRRLGSIDSVIDTCMDRPLREKAARARNVLRLAVAQILYMKVEDHAAVDTAVRLAEVHRSSKPFKGLINAVLRRITREREALAEAAAEKGNTPPAFYRGWQNDWGKRAAAKMAKAHLIPAPLDLTFKPDADLAAWAARLGAEVLPTGSLRLLPDTSVPSLEGYGEGIWWVQDAAAAIPATLFGNQTDSGPADLEDQRVLDLCAAPGGKTAQLAARGARVTALDKSLSRLERLGENLARLGLAAETIGADAATWRPEIPYPFVLLDAPCSATGTVRRHPDLPHIKTRQDIEELAALQRSLLDAAAEMTAPGGTLIYCTCSLERAEGEDQIAAFLNRHPDFERRPITPQEIGGEDGFLNSEGDLRILPFLWEDRGGLDGFYAARLVKEPPAKK